MKKIVSLLTSLIMIFTLSSMVFADSETKSEAENINPFGEIQAKSAVLMEAESGRILYSKEPESALPPASVTKIMTLLLVCEALDSGRFSLEDKVTVSAKAASMGGSQVFLKEGESVSVEELFKSTVIASANDSAYALAELVSGSESVFVSAMNKRAEELGMKQTHFENVTGLDDTTENHLTSALDIAIMSRELIKHETVLSYSSLWQDTIRNGEFTLTNTNRLVRYYDGCNGLKTGSTDKAGYCISATAKRDGMQLIAVIMGAQTRDDRNELAREMLDYGFANYALYSVSEQIVEDAPVFRGTEDKVTLYSAPFSAVVPKAWIDKIERCYTIEERIEAPIAENDELGFVEYYLDGELIGKSSVFSKSDIDKIGYFGLYLNLLKKMFYVC